MVKSHEGKDTLHDPGGLWDNGDIESSNSRSRDELLNCEIFTTLTEA